jgi:nucleotide-binding universal stress UspA family protein
MKMLIPSDGSDAALRSVEHAIDTAGLYVNGIEVHLLNVQLPILSGNVRLFITREKIEEYYREEGMAALSGAKAKLDAAGIVCHTHVGVGNVAETILQYARQNGCDQICMTKSGMGALSRIFLGSVAAKLIHLSEIPVLLIN